MKRLTIEYIENEGKKRGDTLISKEYKNYTTKLVWLCKNGHTFCISWGNYQSGYGCKYCNKSKEETLELIKHESEKRGDVLLSKEYINSKTKMEWTCKNGHKFSKIWSSYKRGVGCPSCAFEEQAERKRKPIEEIKEYANKHNVELISTEYKNSNTPLKWKCENNHIFEMTWSCFNSGHRCHECYKERIKNYNPNKLTIEQIKEQIDDGDELLSTEYINNSSPLIFKCKEGHIFKMPWSSYQQGRRCKFCSIKKCYENRKLTIEQIKEQIDDGDELLSTEYVDSKTKMEWKCREGHIFWMTWNSYKRGNRCKKCYEYRRKYNNSRKLTIEQIRKQVELINDSELLSTEYKNSRSKLLFKCKRDHIYEASWGNYKNGQRCRECKYIEQAEIQKHDYEYVKDFGKNLGFELLSKEYRKANKKLKWKCKDNHIFFMCFADIQQGHGCKKCCNKGFSKAEKEIYELAKSLTEYNVIENDRTQIINPKTGWKLELDIWIPDLMKAIEYNGAYYHGKNTKNYEMIKYKDQQKIEQCKQKGIDLLVINEEDYIKDKEKILNNVRDFINM